MNNNIVPKVIVNPEYFEQYITEYQNNPLIECLPQIQSAKEMLSKAFSCPEVPTNIKDIPSEIRFQLMNRIKDAYFPPAEQLIEIERNISSMIRRGYIKRNPLTSLENYGVLNVLDKIIKTSNKSYYFNSNYCDYSENDNDCMTYSIIGLPGMGKTEVIKKIRDTYPLLIAHNEYKGKPLSLIQIPILKIDCTSFGTKSLGKNFFSALDIFLKETNYYREYGSKSEPEILKQMEILVAQHHIGLLVVDELQHLASAHSESERIMNFFVSLTNTIHVPILFIGTPGALKVCGKDLRTARRIETDGMCYWDRMPYLNENNEPDRKWNSFLRFIWKLQYLKYPVEFTEEFSELMYRYSQGITAIVIALFILIQRRALDREERIEAKLIKEVADRQLMAVKPMIEALRSGDKTKLAKYQDIKLSIDALINAPSRTNESIVLRSFDSQADINQAKEEKPERKPPKSIELKDNKDLRYIFQQAQHNKKDLDIAFKEAGYLRELGENLVI